jgi:hypothetical protein
MDQENVKLLLSYFVVLGLIQFTESLIPGVLEKRIRESQNPSMSTVANNQLNTGPSSLLSSPT